MKQRALIDIDLVLDTRYGTLVRMEQQAADVLAASDTYRDRQHDNFDALSGGVFDLPTYQELYRNRDTETLFHSQMSDFVYMLRQDVKSAIPLMERGVQYTEIEFNLNLWPYELDAQEAEIIRRAFARYIPVPAVVNVVRFSPEELTPEFVENHFEMMAWYNHEDWLIPQKDALIKHPIPLTVLLTPTIASSGVVPQPTQEIQSPFGARAMVLVQFIALHYLPTWYCCYNPFIHQRLRNPTHSASAHPDDPPPASA